MGVNLMLVDEAWKEHPEWDATRFSGDRDFSDWMKDVPKDEKPSGPHDFDGRWRPTDFDAARAAIPADAPNPFRFHGLVGYLEAHPGWWIYLSW
jgi:hypothetical protein